MMTNSNVVIPTEITNYNRTDYELEVFWLFCILVAGKNSDTTSRVLANFLNKLPEDQTPFEGIRELGEDGLHNLLVSHRVGQYNRITKAIWQSLDLDLRNCNREDLMNIYGVSHKTSRFFLLHSREFCEEIVLDTHILRWMKDKCHVIGVPNNTPQNKDKYEYLNASSQPLTYFQRLMNDVIERTSTAMEQDHCLKVMNLAINAQLNAKKMGNLK